LFTAKLWHRFNPSVDTDGKFRRIDEFKGQVTLVFFGFTRCPDVCPTTLMRLRQVRNALGEDAGKVRVLLVSVDPNPPTARISCA